MGRVSLRNHGIHSEWEPGLESLHMMGRVSLRSMVGRTSWSMRHYDTSCLMIASYNPLPSSCSDSQAHLCDDDDDDDEPIVVMLAG